MKIGDTVRLVQPVVQGEIVDTRYNKDATELEHLLQYEDADEVVQERWFLESNLEAVE